MDPITGILTWEKLTLFSVMSFLIWLLLSDRVMLTKVHRDIVADLKDRLLKSDEKCGKWEARAWQSHETAKTAVDTAKEAIDIVATKKEGTGT